MSTLLALARDFIERVSNPVFGARVNEEYGFRLAALLESEGFEQQLNQEISRLDDAAAFTSYGWLWLMGWARAKNVRLRPDLLRRLFEQSSSVFVRTMILEVAVEGEAPRDDRVIADVHEFPDRFLASVMAAAIVRPEEWRLDRERSDRPFEREERLEAIPPSTAAEATLVSLLQAGKPLTLRAATTLLRHRWEGSAALNRFFWTLVDGLDAETRAEWLKRVRPPDRESHL
jgi:hypothetical protein